MIRRFFALATLIAGLLGASQTLACPNWNNPTVFGQATLNAGFLPDPYVRNITAGGRVNLANCYPYLGPGWVVSRPDFRLHYYGQSPTGRMTIALQARSNVDPILVVNAPDGSWHYNDDYRGYDPAIVFFNPMSGQYDIWAGSYHRSSNNPAVLIVTEYNY
ncbi:hypothetical protein [Nioella sediminis]|jgi:hypothetical protein|uniref:hypothetical protein n=1 Tax=Nioella sediminis TaxID=1912092 RepID=UPI0008FD2753|nr:hypothetical protein [Nioella sediminis]TBX16591.1 hypothetical protein TK43_16985 [Roseovarius sp. JS7-11]